MFQKLCLELEEEIKSAYESSVTMEEAEKLAGKFLYAMIQVSKELQEEDLSSRMRKAGLKAVKAAVYLDSCSKSEKKPTEAQLEAFINTNELVAGEQKRFDESESRRDSLQNYFNIFKEAHVHFRGISKGRFE